MLPPEHFVSMKLRRWYKVRWLRNPHPEDTAWSEIEGKTDLVREEDFASIKGFVKVVDEFLIQGCISGIRLGYGKTSEEEIERWINENARK
jgi:hypothetical protein